MVTLSTGLANAPCDEILQIKFFKFRKFIAMCPERALTLSPGQRLGYMR